MQQHFEKISAEQAILNTEKNKTSDTPCNDLQMTSLEKTVLLSDEEQIEQLGRGILAKVRPLSFAAKQSSDFQSERPVSATITDINIRGTPVVRRNDINGQPVVGFNSFRSHSFGFDADVFEEVSFLAEKARELDWAKPALSQNYVQDKILDWLRISFDPSVPTSLVDAIRTAYESDVKPLECWIPIAHLEIEEAFKFGAVEIAPFTSAIIDKLEKKGVEMSPSQRDDITAMFRDLRKRMQGYAAVVIKSNAEPEHARENAMTVAQDVVEILRFFAPLAQHAWQVIPIALLGMDIIPHSQALVLGDETFSFGDGLILAPYSWRLSIAGLGELQARGFEAAAKLVETDTLDEFEQAVRASIMLYSTGSTLASEKDRLIYNLSCAESLLIKHSAENIDFCIGERMAFVFADDRKEANEVARNIREAYRLRRRHGAFRTTTHDRQSLSYFAYNAHRVVSTALSNLSAFGTKSAFIDAIGVRKTTML